MENNIPTAKDASIDHDVPPTSKSNQPSSPPTPPTETLILSHPSARLSSSPASSPRVVESPPARTRSIRPEMSHLMKQSAAPGVDFFEDSSEDGDAEWEDESEPWRLSDIATAPHQETRMAESTRDEIGRGRRRMVHQSNTNPPRDSTLAVASREPASTPYPIGPKTARPVSLRRLGKVHIVHHRASESRDGDAGVGSSKPTSVSGRHRRSTSESIVADSILNAHVITMKALESIPSDAPISPTRTRTRSNSHNVNSQRGSQLLPIQTNLSADESPSHLPTHYARTPYPFTEHEEPPKRQNYHRRRSNGRFDTKKGKQVLGIATRDGQEFDMRSRLESNQDAQGILRTQPSTNKKTTADNSDQESQSKVWLTLKRPRKNSFVGGDCRPKVETFSISNNLTATLDSGLKSDSGKKNKRKKTKDAGSKAPGPTAKSSTVIDFDDMLFSQRLHNAYNSLAGPWILRVFGARKLTGICLVHIDKWSGDGNESSFGPAGRQLLAARDGSGLATLHTQDTNGEASFDFDVFTEDQLMKLYRDPKSGKARYTWVHWVQRLSSPTSSPSHSPDYSASSSSSESSSFSECDQNDTNEYHEQELPNTNAPNHPEEANPATTATTTRTTTAQPLPHLHFVPNLPKSNPRKSRHHPPTTTNNNNNNNNPHSNPKSSQPRRSPPSNDSLLAIQFTQSLSPLRIALAVLLILGLSTAAALLWILVPRGGGEYGVGSERVSFAPGAAVSAVSASERGVDGVDRGEVGGGGDAGGVATIPAAAGMAGDAALSSGAKTGMGMGASKSGDGSNRDIGQRRRERSSREDRVVGGVVIGGVGAVVLGGLGILWGLTS